MTTNEISLFKQFMKSRDILTMFTHQYSIHKMTINPDSIDGYLERANAESVIPQAFVYPQTLHGKDFWLAVHEEWLEELRNHRASQSNIRCMEQLDLEVISLTERAHNYGLPKNTCSLSLKGGNRLTLNMEHSKMVAKKLSTKMLLTRSRQTMDVVLMFNRVKGIDVKFKPGLSSLQFNNAELADHLIDLLELDASQEYFHIGIELLAETKDYLLFKLKNKE